MAKSKFFRVATEGTTTDGRQVERLWIEQMAKNFNREKYGARVWLEHYRGTVPGGPFDALGDVLAVEARTVENGKLALFAQIEPLPALIEMNKKGQKLYTSIEVHPQFADSGEAYFSGLAVTDSPASLGTEILKFSAGAAANPFAARKSDKATLFTAAEPVTLEFEDGAPTGEGGALQAVVAMFKTTLEKLSAPAPAPAAPVVTATPAAPPAQNHSTGLAPSLTDVMLASTQTVQALADQATATHTALTKLQGQVDALVQQLSQQPEGSSRPYATGGDGVVRAEF